LIAPFHSLSLIRSGQFFIEHFEHELLKSRLLLLFDTSFDQDLLQIINLLILSAV